MTFFLNLVSITFCVWLTPNVHIKPEDSKALSKNIQAKKVSLTKCPDSLKMLSYDTLEKRFLKNKFDSIKAQAYAGCYLSKAKKDRDTFRIAEGYFFMNAFNENEVDLSYADSIIEITKNFKNNKYPGKGHLLKGNAYYSMGNYVECLNQYIIAADYARQNGSDFQYRSLKFNIGVLKMKLGENSEALRIFKSYVQYLEQHELQEKYPASYNSSLYTLADSYANEQKTDSADLYIQKGIRQTLQTRDSVLYPYFILNSGVNLYQRKKFREALDSLAKARNYIEKQTNPNISKKLVLYQYLGKVYAALNNTEESISYLEKVSETLETVDDFNPELTDSYKDLITYYKSKNNPNQQLYYIEGLLRYDSILDKNYKLLSKKIAKNYDTSELIYEKNKLLDSLTKKSKSNKTQIIALVSIILICLGFAFYYVRKSMLYKRRFKLLIENKIPTENALQKVSFSDRKSQLPEEVIKDILVKLEDFEQSNKFLTINSMTDLAKELKTNTTYLSQVINSTKNVNFSGYVNNLKIEYAIKRLKEDPKFRKYTIKAIAEEVGFNNAQSFSSAFYKKTKLYPSFFVKEINKQ